MSADYHFVTHWRVESEVACVYNLLSEPLDYPRWIRGMKIKVRSLASGDSRGIGRRDFYEVAGALPYILRWELECIEAEPPCRIVTKAKGDLTGTGIWTFQQKRIWTDITFDWQVSLDQPFLRPFSVLFRPFFEWNHDWVMSRWEESLKRELLKKKDPVSRG